MTLTRAHKLINFTIKQKVSTKQGLLDPNMSWNQGNDTSKELADGLAGYIDKDISWLKVLQKQLPPLPKCKHSKELRDRCDGKWYCMGCNEDLE